MVKAEPTDLQNFPGLVCPEKCLGKIPGLSRISRTRMNHMRGTEAKLSIPKLKTPLLVFLTVLDMFLIVSCLFDMNLYYRINNYKVLITYPRHHNDSWQQSLIGYYNICGAHVFPGIKKNRGGRLEQTFNWQVKVILCLLWVYHFMLLSSIIEDLRA